MRYFTAPLLFALSTAVPYAQAREIPDLTRHLQEEIETFHNAIESTCSDSGNSSCLSAADASSGTDQAWYYRRFWIRIRPSVTFQIPGFASLEITPEMELLWERGLPQGWSTYKP